ncbi:hypothetical protein VIGAN_UM080400 [Vigna angularis var. angularis]|uniref:Uncharacterized protein n=1 Tax=Vigna angularis var. angularis TaxID=157739 RepID=A0A0S3TDY0_PHAAN|nr:hypothetical protein VIGAN_UM080400 [Vigna angularis var. angularis]
MCLDFDNLFYKVMRITLEIQPVRIKDSITKILQSSQIGKNHMGLEEGRLYLGSGRYYEGLISSSVRFPVLIFEDENFCSWRECHASDKINLFLVTSREDSLFEAWTALASNFQCIQNQLQLSLGSRYTVQKKRRR